MSDQLEAAVRALRDALEAHDLACRLLPYDHALHAQTVGAVEAARARLAAVAAESQEATQQ